MYRTRCVTFALAMVGCLMGRALAQCAVSFAPPTSYPLGFQAGGLAFADFDLDGRPEVIITDSLGTAVGIYEFNAAGVPQALPGYTVGSQPRGIAVGDLNNDGRPDFVVANSLSNTISVFIAAGPPGNFNPPVTYNTLGQPRGVALGHFNADAFLDLAVACATNGAVSVMMGNGNGTFQPAVNYTTGSGAIAVVAGDFNGDGIDDLAVANQGASTVSILRGFASGTFQQVGNYPVGAGPNSIVAGDFNGDGVLDLATSNISGNNVSVLLGSGGPQLTFQAAVNYPTSPAPAGVATGLINADGALDLVTATSNAGAASVLRGNIAPALGTFAAPALFSLGSGNCAALGVRDINGDGKPDIVAATTAGGGTLVILLNTSPPGAPAITQQPVTHQTVVAGLQATLSVQANAGGTPLTYQWRKDTIPLSDGGHISGAATATLTINPALAGDAGGYDVQVSMTGCTGGIVTTTSAVGVISIDTSQCVPALTRQPTPTQTVAAGASVTVSVVANGFGHPLVYQWRKDGVPLTDDGSISGSSTATLAISPVMPAGAGSYDVRVSMVACGGVTASTISNPGIISVDEALGQPQSIDLGTIGTPGTLSVTFSLTPGLIQWYRFTLSNPIARASNYLDIGTLSNAGTPANTDTEIALYRWDGSLVATDDDSGPHEYSELSFGTGCPTRPSTQPPLPDGLAMMGQSGDSLPAGTYFLAVAEYDATFNPTNWSVTATSTWTGEVRVFFNSDVASTVPPSLTSSSISQTSVRPGQTILIAGTLAACGSAGASVTLDASPLGDSNAVAMYDDSTHGDAAAGDNVFSIAYTIPVDSTAGPYTLNINASSANGLSAPRTAALTVVTPTTLTAVGGVYTEVEDNNSKGQANNVTCFAPGEALSGTTTGRSTTTAGLDSADYYRLKTCAASPAIYLHTLALTAPTSPTSYSCEIRGVSQLAGVSLFDDTTFQQAVTADQSVKWYGFGAQEEVLYRATGTAATTGAYTATHNVVVVPPIVVSPPLAPGSITIDRDPTNTADVDMIVLDSSFTPVAGYMNDGQNALTRTFPEGTFFVGFGNFNTANNQASPPDDSSPYGELLDLPNGVANDSRMVISNMNIRFTHAGGVTTAAGSRINPFEVVWYMFTVQLPTNPVGRGTATPGSIPITGSTLLRVQVAGPNDPPSTGLAVVADLTSMNGSATQQFYDDGTHGDEAAGDNIFSLSVTANEPLSAGAVGLPFTVSDAQGRSSNGGIPLTLTAAPTGSCCMHGTCSARVTAYNCTQGGGTYNGDGSNCYNSMGTLFSSNNTFPIAIPGPRGGGSVATITIPSGHGNINGLAVRVGLTYTWVGDLILELSKDGPPPVG
jgi:hypothetical protein